MEDFQSETDSDYTSYWRDWVCLFLSQRFSAFYIAYTFIFDRRAPYTCKHA